MKATDVRVNGGAFIVFSSDEDEKSFHVLLEGPESEIDGRIYFNFNGDYNSIRLYFKNGKIEKDDKDTSLGEKEGFKSGEMLGCFINLKLKQLKFTKNQKPFRKTIKLNYKDIKLEKVKI